MAQTGHLLFGGALHGLFLALHKMYRDVIGRKKDKENIVIHIVSVFFNSILVALLWVIFRSDSMKQAVEMFTGLFRTQGITYVNVYVVIYFAIVLLGHLLGGIKNGGHALVPNLNLDSFKGKVIFCTWIFLIIAFMYVGDSAFIYSQF